MRYAALSMTIFFGIGLIFIRFFEAKKQRNKKNYKDKNNKREPLKRLFF